MEQKNPPRHIVAVAGLVTDRRGRILMLYSPLGDWEFPGGQVEEGETLTRALQREILEETGIAAEIGALVGIYSNLAYSVDPYQMQASYEVCEERVI